MSPHAPPPSDDTFLAFIAALGTVSLDPGGSLSGGVRLSLTFFSATATLRRSFRHPGALELDATLPDGDGRATLTPQPPGVLGRIKARGEQQLGVTAADDAWIVRGDDASWPLLRALADHLATLAAHGRAGEDRALPAAVALEFAPSTLHATVTPAQLPALLALWERAVSHRLGN